MQKSKSKILKLTLIFIALFYQSLTAQFGNFGRNKVQYDDFDWHIITTENFNIYYYPEIEYLAEIGAKFAENSFSDLRIKFNFQINQKIPLIFYNTHNHFQQTNTIPYMLPPGVGGFFEFIKGRVVIPYNGSIKQFEHVIKHELIHVFTQLKLSRIKKDYRLLNDISLPLWFTEGLAEFWSSDWDNQAEMVMRDAVLNNYYVPLRSIENIYGSFLMYKEGQKILTLISKKYGQDKIPEIIDNVWRYSSFNNVLEYCLETKIEDLDNWLLTELKSEYYSEVKYSEFILNDSKKITKEGYNTSPVLYKIGNTTYIYYMANYDGYSSVYRIKLSDNELDPELVIRGEKSEELETFHLFNSNLSIANNKLAFISKVKNRDAIVIYDLAKEEIINYLSFDNIVQINNVNWANKKEEIIISAIGINGFTDLYIYSFDDDRLSQLTNDYYDDKDPIYYKNDSLIIFSSDRTNWIGKGIYNIFSYNISDKKIKYITFDTIDCTFPKLDFTKNELFFLSAFDKTNQIFSINYNPYFEKEETIFNKNRCTNYLSSILSFEILDTNFIYETFESYSFNIYITNKYKSLEKAEEKIISNEFNPLLPKWTVDRFDLLGKRKRYEYQKTFSLDFAQSQITTNPVYGTTGGALFSVSDLLGDEQYIFYIFNNAQSTSDFLQSFNVSISKVSLEKRTNNAFGIFHFSGRRYDIRESDEYFFERSFGGFFSLIFPFSVFRRIELNTSIANSNKELYGFIKSRKAVLLSNSISYIFDNSIWYYTGPIDGTRYSILFGITNDIKYSNVNYYSFMFDFRHYFRLGFQSTLATRFQLFYNQGRETRRYFMGGNWDLRGWNRWSIRGEKLWFSSIELRIPLIEELSIKMPFGKMSFYGLRGAIFYDMGSAWDDKYKETLGSIGFGFRINLFGVLVLRYDMGKKIEDNFNKFQSTLFYQFFFGWDF